MQIVDRLNNRFRLLSKQTALKCRHSLQKGDIAVDYGCMKLNFSNDGDLQEVMYHAYCRTWHDNEKNLLGRHIRAGQTLVDVGANMGFIAVILSNLTGPHGRVLCFEPSKKTFEKLRRTVELNNLENVELYNHGCGVGNSKATLFKASKSSGNSSLRPPASSSSDDTEAIDLVSLDAVLLPTGQPIDFIKIDVEGYEPSVLKGALEILRFFKPTVYIELGGDYADSSAEAVEILRGIGYSFAPEPNLHEGNGTNFIATHKDRL